MILYSVDQNTRSFASRSNLFLYCSIRARGTVKLLSHRRSVIRMLRFASKLIFRVISKQELESPTRVDCNWYQGVYRSVMARICIGSDSEILRNVFTCDVGGNTYTRSKLFALTHVNTLACLFERARRLFRFFSIWFLFKCLQQHTRTKHTHTRYGFAESCLEYRGNFVLRYTMLLGVSIKVDIRRYKTLISAAVATGI